MSEIKISIAEQLRQLQMLMHRADFHGFMGEGRAHSPHRGQGRVLAILKMKPEISQKELGYLLGTSKQALAELLTKLERGGFIAREPSEEDRRVMTIRLTEEGRNSASSGGAEGESEGAGDILDCLSEEELRAFSGFLSRIIERCEERFPGEDYEERRRVMAEFLSRYGRGRGFGERGGDPRGFAGRPGDFSEFFGHRGGEIHGGGPRGRDSRDGDPRGRDSHDGGPRGERFRGHEQDHHYSDHGRDEE